MEKCSKKMCDSVGSKADDTDYEECVALAILRYNAIQGLCDLF